MDVEGSRPTEPRTSHYEKRHLEDRSDWCMNHDLVLPHTAGSHRPSGSELKSSEGPSTLSFVKCGCAGFAGRAEADNTCNAASGDIVRYRIRCSIFTQRVPDGRLSNRRTRSSTPPGRPTDLSQGAAGTRLRGCGLGTRRRGRGPALVSLKQVPVLNPQTSLAT